MRFFGWGALRICGVASRLPVKYWVRVTDVISRSHPSLYLVVIEHLLCSEAIPLLRMML